MAHSLADICVDRFARLQKYFVGINVEDLPSLDEEDLFEAAEPADKILMRLFLRENNLFYDSKPVLSIPAKRYDLSSTASTWPPIEEAFDERKRVVNFEKKLVAASFSAKQALGRPPSYYPIERLADLTLFSLADNGFHDGHLMNIVEFLKVVFPGLGRNNFYRLEMLDLSYNRFHGMGLGIDAKDFDAIFTQLLKNMPPNGFVDVTFNPMASVDKKGFFHTLYKEEPTHAMKLVWIPEAHLGISAWATFIPDAAKVEEVREAHARYYKRRKDLN